MSNDHLCPQGTILQAGVRFHHSPSELPFLGGD